MRKILIFILCFCTLFLCFVIPSFADELVIPTDLTGFTAIFPSNMTFTRYLGGSLDVSGTLYSQGYSQVFSNIFSSIFNSPRSDIAFLFNDTSTENYLSTSGGVYEIDALFGELLYITFDGGADTDNAGFIQWLVDNNATFVPDDPDDPDDPEPVTYTIPSGYYKLSELPSEGVPSVGGFVVNIEHLFEVPVEVYYSSGVVKQYNYFGFMLTNFEDSNNFSVDFTVQLLDIGNSIRIANLTAVDGVCSSQFYGGITNFYIGEDVVTDEESYQLISFMFDLDSSFIPDEPDIPDIPTNPWAYILEMIIEALKVPLFGYFSVWDIFVTIMGIFILTWLLKLLAGG